MNIQQSSAYSNHDEIWLLIPWYANGSLEGSDHDRVKAHLQVCLVCRRELASQAMLAKHLEHNPSVEISYKPSFERLMSRIHQEEVIKANRNRQGKVSWLAYWINLPIASFTPKHVATAFATGLLAVTLALWFGGMPSDGVKTYHTVANVNSLDPFNASDIRVIFADQVTTQEIGKLIGSIHGSLVDGPNPVGIYTVRISGGESKEASLTQALSQLRGNKAVVFAEPALPQQTDKPKGGGG